MKSFVVHLPFWTVWARVAAWVFGEEKVGSGDDARYQPREIRVVQDMTWNGAACDVGEFGVTQVPPVEEDLQPFDPDELHRSGMVFEPVSSFSEARQTAHEQFKDHVRRAKRTSTAWRNCSYAACDNASDWYITLCGCCATFTAGAPSRWR